MSKGDWFSSKGWAERARGLRKKESRGKKCCVAIFFFFCAVVCLVIGGLQLQHAKNAAAINSDFDGMTLTMNAYDGCNLPAYSVSSDADLEDIENGYAEIAEMCSVKKEFFSGGG